MKYQVTIKNKLSELTKETIVITNSAKAAIEMTIGTQSATDVNESVYTAYPVLTDENGVVDGYAVLKAALQIAHTSAARSINRTGGNDTQRTIERELNRCLHCADTDASESATILFDAIARMSAHAQDYHGFAYKGLLEGLSEGLNFDDIIKKGYQSLNLYIMNLRNKANNETSIEYFCRADGETESVNQYIDRALVVGDFSYEVEFKLESEKDKLRGVYEFLTHLYTCLTPRQRLVLKYRVKGYKTVDIQKALDCKSVGTISAHIASIREKAINLINNDHYTALSEHLDMPALLEGKIRSKQSRREKKQKQRNK